MTRDGITVLIPAAGRVPDGIVALANITCPAMIPVGGRPVIHWTLRYLRDLGLKDFHIAVSSRGMFVEDFVECAHGSDANVRFIVPSKQAGLGRTVLDLLETVETESALIVLGDTHFELERPELLTSTIPFVVTHPVEESYRWCTAETDEAGVVTKLHDKERDLASLSAALIGVYFFPDAKAALEAAREAVTAHEPIRGRTEMAAILERVQARTPIRAERARLWVDVGNADMLAASHRLMLSAREFNELTVDPVLGTITKKSRHKAKFIDEINYLRLLPSDIAVLFPRLLSFSTEWESPSVTMEYYGYPSLSEVFIFEGVDPGIWEQVFEHLLAVLERGFLRHEHPLAPGALTEMCVGKTRARLASLEGPPELVRLVTHEGDVVINGRSVPSLRKAWSRIEKRIEGMEQTAQGTIIHGDLCFSNILYDLRARIVKLVDPRGSFGSQGIYGDVRYDVAKLYHSVAGLYDFIVNDLFHVEAEDLEVKLEIRRRPGHEDIQRRFEKIFFARFDARDVKLLTGLLFLSMPPLHADSPRRQLAMYARGLELLGDALHQD